MSVSRFNASKTYGDAKIKKDTSSALFDEILVDQSKGSGGLRRSPRKLNPHPALASRPVKSPEASSPDPFAFDEASSPPEPMPPPRSTAKRKAASPLSPPAILGGCEPEDDDEEELGSSSSSSAPATSSSSNSQGSGVSAGLKAVRLSPTMPPPRSPPLRSPPPPMVKSASAPGAASMGAPKARKGVYAWRRTDSDSDEEETTGDAFAFREPRTHEKQMARSGVGNRRPWAGPEQGLLRSVKDAHQIHDHGEVAEHKGDVDYLLSSLREGSTPEVRILSMLQVARKSLKAAFRQFLRSRGLLSGLFRGLLPHLADSPTLCLPASAILYLLSRDRLGFPPDADCLRLTLALLRSTGPPSPAPPSYAKCRDKVWEILSAWRSACEQSLGEFSFDVTRENLTPSFLTTEALVYIGCRCTEPAQKAALLTHGLVQYTAQTLAEECGELAGAGEVELDPASLERLKLIERRLRFLEHATTSVDNQKFLVSFRNSLIIGTCGKLMRFFHAALRLVPGGQEEEDLAPEHRHLLSALARFARLLCNLSNHNELCCMRLGQTPDFLRLTFQLLTEACPKRLPPSKVFDTQFILVSLLINLVEHCNANRRLLLALRVPVHFAGREPPEQEHPTTAAITELFAFHSSRADVVEEEVDRRLTEGAEAAAAKGPGTGREEAALQASVESAMSQAGAHMEEGIMAAYLALFLGFLVLQNEYVVAEVRDLLPEGRFQPMVKAMQQLSEFMELTDSVNKSALLSIAKVIELFEKFDRDA